MVINIKEIKERFQKDKPGFEYNPDTYSKYKMDIEGVLFVTNSSIFNFGEGKIATKLILKDLEGTKIESTVWKRDVITVANKTGSIYIKGTLGIFRNEFQITIEEITSSEEVYPENLERLENLKERLRRILEEIEDENIRDFCISLTLYDDKFLTTSAAIRNHHAYRYGLLEHSIQVAELSLSIYNGTRDVKLNKDLLIAGAILHDIGKTEIYEMNSELITYNVDNAMIEHISLAMDLTRKAADKVKLDPVKLRMIRHIILSHHGEYEYGSPVRPMFLEAMIVNKADGISSFYGAIENDNGIKSIMGHKNFFMPNAISERWYGVKIK